MIKTKRGITTVDGSIIFVYADMVCVVGAIYKNFREKLGEEAANELLALAWKSGVAIANGADEQEIAERDSTKLSEILVRRTKNVNGM